MVITQEIEHVDQEHLGAVLFLQQLLEAAQLGALAVAAEAGEQVDALGFGPVQALPQHQDGVLVRRPLQDGNIVGMARLQGQGALATQAFVEVA